MMQLEDLPFDIINKIASHSTPETVQNLRLTCRSLNSHLRRIIWETLIIKLDYVSDVLPTTKNKTGTDLHMVIKRNNITTLMACDNARDGPFIAELLPYVKYIQIGGFSPAPITNIDSGLLNKKFVDQLFDRLISDIIPQYTSSSTLKHISIVGSKYEYISESSSLFDLISKTKNTKWSFDMVQTPLTAEFIAYGLSHERIEQAKIVIMSDFVADNSWLDENMPPLSNSLTKLTVEADQPGKVKLRESLKVCQNLFSKCQLKSLSLSGLQLNTQLFKAIPDSVRELTIIKCEISGSETAKVSVDNLMLDTEQKLAPAITLVADTLERVNLENVNINEFSNYF